MIEIVIDGKRIVPTNGSCITFEDGKLLDIGNPSNLSFDPYEGMPEFEDISRMCPDQE